MKCPLCGKEEMSTGEPFRSKNQIISHIFSSGDENHKGYSYQDGERLLEEAGIGQDEADETSEDTPVVDTWDPKEPETEQSEATEPGLGTDPAAEAPEGGEDVAEGHGESCPDCGAATEDDGFDDVRDHNTVATATGSIDVSEIDFICWNCREAYTQQ